MRCSSGGDRFAATAVLPQIFANPVNLSVDRVFVAVFWTRGLGDWNSTLRFALSLFCISYKATNSCGGSGFGQWWDLKMQ
jgi:hypothetical protein